MYIIADSGYIVVYMCYYYVDISVDFRYTSDMLKIEFFHLCEIARETVLRPSNPVNDVGFLQTYYPDEKRGGVYKSFRKYDYNR